MNPSLPSSMLQDVNKMKGDAIGDTMYSERWVLKILMKLSEKYMEYTSADDYHLESDLENDLGLLWDMTIEPDVAKFLLQNDALDLLRDVIKFSNSPRLTEIMIGILGNLACEENVRRKIGTNTELIQVVINLLNMSDSLTLVQLVRLLKTCIWDVGSKVKEHDKDGSNDESKKECDSCWVNCLKEESALLSQRLTFILASSRNEDLLISTLGLMESLFNSTWYHDDFFCREFSTESVITALTEAINEITGHVEDMTESFLNHRKLKEACAHWVAVLHRMTYHNVGLTALEKQVDKVFDPVNNIWIEQSAKGRTLSSNHIVHLILALELLEMLLPCYSQCYKMGNVLAILSAVSEPSTEDGFSGEEEGVDTKGLKETLKDFCFSAAKQWKLRGVEIDELKHYTHQEINLLEQVLLEKTRGNDDSSVDSPSDVDVTLVKLKKIIENIETEH